MKVKVVEEDDMRYIISDIHGCKKQYLELLGKIKFSEQDHLYILGDSVDRGEEPIEILRYIMKQKNVTYIIGNHDYILYLFIKKAGLNLDNFENDEIKWSFKFWQCDGGLPTIEGFLALSEYERKEIYEFIDNEKHMKKSNMKGNDIFYLMREL